MTDEKLYAAMRAYIDIATELQAKKVFAELKSTLPAETRAVEPIVGPKGDPGPPGKDGKDSTVPGPKGDKGDPGVNGIATREELEMIVEQRMADIQVRTFADMYQGVWSPEHEPYTRSQAVTWGGQLYLALADTKGKPAESPDWRLIVKAGRDGKR